MTPATRTTAAAEALARMAARDPAGLGMAAEAVGPALHALCLRASGRRAVAEALFHQTMLDLWAAAPLGVPEGVPADRYAALICHRRIRRTLWHGAIVLADDTAEAPPEVPARRFDEAAPDAAVPDDLRALLRDITALPEDAQVAILSAFFAPPDRAHPLRTASLRADMRSIPDREALFAALGLDGDAPGVEGSEAWERRLATLADLLEPADPPAAVVAGLRSRFADAVLPDAGLPDGAARAPAASIWTAERRQALVTVSVAAVAAAVIFALLLVNSARAHTPDPDLPGFGLADTEMASPALPRQGDNR